MATATAVDLIRADNDHFERLKQTKMTPSSRDDSGNSSNSSSLEHLQPVGMSDSQEDQLQKQQLNCDGEEVEEFNNVVHSTPLSGVGYDVDRSNDDEYFPLHRTVCCSLCRYRLHSHYSRKG